MKELFNKNYKKKQSNTKEIYAKNLFYNQKKFIVLSEFEANKKFIFF